MHANSQLKISSWRWIVWSRPGITKKRMVKAVQGKLFWTKMLNIFQHDQNPNAGKSRLNQQNVWLFENNLEHKSTLIWTSTWFTWCHSPNVPSLFRFVFHKHQRMSPALRVPTDFQLASQPEAKLYGNMIKMESQLDPLATTLKAGPFRRLHPQLVYICQLRTWIGSHVLSHLGSLPLSV